jgi:hypothetical protein
MGLHCKQRAMAEEKTQEAASPVQQAQPGAEGRPFQLLPQLRHPDARFTLQNGVQDLRLLSELQRFLLRNTHHGDTEAQRDRKPEKHTLFSIRA